MTEATDAPVFDEVWREHPEGLVLHLALRGRTRLNVVNSGLLNRAEAVLQRHFETPGLRCVVLESAQPRAWIGGADLAELGSLTTATAEHFIRSIHGVCRVIRDAPIPVLASIRGYCLGGGLEIAAACDLRIADESARFGMPEVRVGVPSVIEAALLPQLIGWGRTRELVYRGHLVEAAEAARIGLVEHCVAEAALDARRDEIIRDILQGAPRAIELQKRLVRHWEDLTPDAAIDAGVGVFVSAYESDEPARYVAKFYRRNDG